MNLKYQFRTVTGRFCLEQIRMALSEEYDFAYAPYLQGGQKLFREVTPEMRNYRFPFKVLLFSFVVEPDAPYTDHIARQDIYSGLEYLSIMGWDTLLWEWQICQADNQEQGEVPIYYKYDIDGDDHHIFYDRLPDKGKVLAEALQEIIEYCNCNSPYGETQEDFADRIERVAIKALGSYEERRELCQ